MHRADHHDHDLHAIVDHQLDGDELRTALDRLVADPQAAARCAAYIRQRAALTSLRDGLALSPPAPSLATLEGELRAAMQGRDHMRLAMAVGATMALLIVIGFASLPPRGGQAAAS